MKRLLLLLVVAACANKIPETRYYQLATTAKPVKASSTAVLAVEPLETESAYDDERIVYRTTPFRLDYYQYHRWSSAPGVLVGNYLEQAFEKSGRFRAVTRELTPGTHALLGGRVIAIEEVDSSKTRWVGRIVLELTLTDPRTGDVIWNEQFEETEPMSRQHPEGLAHSISVAMARITKRAAPIIADHADRIAAAGVEKTPMARRPVTKKD